MSYEKLLFGLISLVLTAYFIFDLLSGFLSSSLVTWMSLAWYFFQRKKKVLPIVLKEIEKGL